HDRAIKGWAIKGWAIKGWAIKGWTDLDQHKGLDRKRIFRARHPRTRPWPDAPLFRHPRT
ncbi:MAG: hypothetical protein QOG25_1367, partial [Acetobacteraceae bacterium]|nr:hypothetical protein [Acetobacteraceae bacterium]